MRSLFAAALVLALAGTADAQMSDRDADTLQVQFMATELYSAEQGRRLHRINETRGLLPEGQGHEYSATLSADQSYLLVGVCDKHCGTLHLQVFSNGQLLAQDLDGGDLPMVPLSGSGDVTVRAWMAECDSRQCAFGVNLYTQ